MLAMARTRAASGNFKPNDDYEKMQFYYHPDHLGSSSYITNLDGEVSQHIEYVPFGEVFIEERNNTWNTPYLFNAKDLDEETGMYYYDGARYYAPRLNLWMSTDPLQEKYHNISSYCYTFNNTIKFIDPNGQDGWDKVKGFGAALLDNATGGLINLRSYAGRHVSNPTDFNRGLAAGDAASVGIGTREGGTGAGMIASGTTITTVGLAAEGPCLGTSTVVVVIGGGRQQGAVLVAHGSVMAANGAKNLVNKKGHLNENAPRGSGNKHSSGKSAQLPSKTLWKGKGKSGARIDVENSNPTQRRG